MTIEKQTQFNKELKHLLKKFKVQFVITPVSTNWFGKLFKKFIKLKIAVNLKDSNE